MESSKENYQEPIAMVIVFNTSDIITNSAKDPCGLDKNWDVEE